MESNSIPLADCNEKQLILQIHEHPSIQEKFQPEPSQTKTRLAQAKPESRRKSFEKREISQAWNSNQSYNK